jgi:ATP-dependent helicase/DNAse subunit B
MSRLAYRRFARTLETLQDNLSPEVQILPTRRNGVTALAHLEANLFCDVPDPVRAGVNVAFVEAQNTSLEAREALRWIKARVTRDGLKPSECAVIAYDIAPYRSFLRSVAREFGVPFHLSCGEPLVSNPAVAAVLNLVELPLLNWARRPLLDVLRTPYLDLSLYGLGREDAWQLDETARVSQVIEGIDQWEEALALAATEDTSHRSENEIDDTRGDDEEGHAPRRPMGGAAQALWERLLIFHERLMPPSRGSMADYARWVEDLLAERSGTQLVSCILAQKDTAERDKTAIEAFLKALGALALAESVVARPKVLTYAEFCAQLRSVIDSATYQMDDEFDRRQGRVYATDLKAARGVCYRAVAILGLSEGLRPAPLREDPLLSDEDREECAKAGLPLEPRLRSDQQTVFYEGVTRATEYLLLCRPYLADDGELWEPSPYWTATRILFDASVQRVRPEDTRPHCEAASPAELLDWCVRRRSLPGDYRGLAPEWENLRQLGEVLRSRIESADANGYEGSATSLSAALTTRFGPDHVWSASRLESYGACPFQFYATTALGLEERKPPELGYDASQLGSMLHEILERVYRQTRDPLSLDELLTTLPPVAEAVLDEAPRKYGFRPTPLWETQRQELIDILSRTLSALVAQEGAFWPVHFELRFGLDGSPPLRLETDQGRVLLRGVIDRVDIDAERNIRIIDYKTGSSGLHQNDLAEGRRLQLPIYSLAAANCLELGTPADGFYWSILSGKAGHLRLEKFRHETDDGVIYHGADGAMDLAIAHIGNFLRGIREGSFRPSPPSGGCKGYCAARRFCWRYQPQGW